MSMKIGKHTIIWQPCNLYGCIIGDECIIGVRVEIGKNVVIGNRCKIGAGSYIPTGVKIGDGVQVSPHVAFSNDKYPSAVNRDGSLKCKNDWKCLETIVEDNVAIGTNSTILPGVTLGKGCVIGAGSVVTKNIPPFMLAYGNPAVVVKKVKQ